jgi:hypothetical protein
MKNSKNFTRRQFLVGAGGSYLALPFLPSLLPRSAWGQTVTIPKRLLAMQTPNGTCVKNWHPAIDPTKVIAPNVRELELSTFSGPLSTIMGPELTAFRSKLLILRGLDGRGGDGHANAEILAGSRPTGGVDRSSMHISIDQILASSKKIYPTEPKMRVLSISGCDRENSISYFKSGDAIVSAPVIHDMKVAFETLFSGIGASPEEADTKKARNLSLVDGVFADYQKVMSSSKLSSTDKMRLDSHITHISELQKRLQESKISAGCAVPTGGKTYSASEKYEVLDPYVDNMLDIMVAALRCDLTRFVNFFPFSGGFKFPFIPTQYADVHSLSHQDNALSDVALTDVQIYIVKKYALLLKKLNDVIEDPSDGSTLLDHTAVLWRQEFTGNGIHNHKKIDVPVLIAGAGKFLKTGRYVDYRTIGVKRRDYDHTWIGLPYNQLLVTLLNTFGLTPAEYELPGEAGIGTYGDPASPDYISDYKITDATRRTELFSLRKT